MVYSPFLFYFIDRHFQPTNVTLASTINVDAIQQLLADRYSEQLATHQRMSNTLPAYGTAYMHVLTVNRIISVCTHVGIQFRQPRITPAVINGMQIRPEHICVFFSVDFRNFMNMRTNVKKAQAVFDSLQMYSHWQLHPDDITLSQTLRYLLGSDLLSPEHNARDVYARRAVTLTMADLMNDISMSRGRGPSASAT